MAAAIVPFGPVALHHHRTGSGPPLLLLHGLGSQWQMWRPVLDRLAREHDVVAADLPGFGRSEPLPPATEPHPGALADAVARLLDELGWERPAVAGNSLGGWVGLELAKRGRASAVCALSPAGFWTRREARFCAVSLTNARNASRVLEGQLPVIYGNPVLRTLAAWQLVHRPWRMPPELGVEAARNFAHAPGFDATRDAMASRHFTGGREVRGAVTIAWGEYDRLLLPRQAPRAHAAIPGSRRVTLRGCGHVPTWDDPDEVAGVILDAVGAAA